jgi:hypothetical protein
MSEVRHHLLITLVHGTWPRGLFPRIFLFKQRVRGLMRRKRLGAPPFWFEEGSPFLARLTTELRDISHKIKPLLWSGENSIFERDKTAHVLAEHLSAEHAENQQATQLVIAHSHGGNIALRALHDSQKRNASQVDGADNANPLVVTLGTPFIEVHQADFGHRPLQIRGVVVLVTFIFVAAAALLLFKVSFPSFWDKESGFDAASVVFVLAVVLFCLLQVWWSLWWIWGRAAARQNQLDALKDATRLPRLLSAERFLVIRAVDDEASLALGLGTIVNYVTARSIAFPFSLLMLSVAILNFLIMFGLPRWAYVATLVGYLAFIIMLLGMLMVARSLHGRELAVSPMECQINTQSTPDAKGLSEIITLVRRTYVKSLRHGIYEHEDCAKAISDWVRSHVRHPPVEWEINAERNHS